MPLQFSAPGRLRNSTMAMARLAIASLAFAACATDQPSAVIDTRPAALAVHAIVPRTDATAGPAAVRISVAYLRQNGSVVALGAPQTFPLDQNTQAVPVSVDVATCLADPTRLGTGTAAPAADECHVQLTLDFLLNGVRVDQQVLSNISVTPGKTSAISQPIALAQVGDARVIVPAANMQQGSFRIEQGENATLGVQVTDVNGQVIAGRTATWTSANASVATVSAAGVVTGVTMGSTQITAVVAGREIATATVVTVPSQLITVSSTGANGKGSVQSNPSGLSCAIDGTQATGTCSARFPGDANVQLLANAATTADFVAFTGDCASMQGTTCNVSPTVARQVKVGFKNRLMLTVSGIASGNGTVQSSSGAIQCVLNDTRTTGVCADSYSDGARVTLQAAATAGSVFEGWTGDCASETSTSCTVVMDRARTAAAVFSSSTRLTIRANGAGNGVVTSMPSGLQCSATAGATSGACVSGFPVNSQVTLTPSAPLGSRFTGWSGACNGSGACVVSMTESQTVTATFASSGAPLTIITSGPGGGVITTSTGDSCVTTGMPNTCTVFAAIGSTVQITADPGKYLRFIGFGDACSGTGSCSVVMNAARTVSANFGTRDAMVYLVLSGTGAGTVSSDADFQCSLAQGDLTATCSAKLVAGRSVRFTATPQSGSLFNGWQPCAGSGDCVVAADNLVINAEFKLRTFAVGVGRSPGAGGTGQVVFGPANSRCSITSTGTSGTCVAEVIPGSQVTFTIDPSVGTPFVSWGGACASFGSNPVCRLTANGPLDVTARFQ